jgi:murein DD-endopeptidase MepM/ murein hydrolase activator NlpD
MEAPAPAPPSVVTRALGMAGRATLAVATGLARRRTADVAMRNLRLLIVLLATATVATVGLFLLPMLLVLLLLGTALSAGVPVSGAVPHVPGPPLAPGLLACPVPGGVVTQPFGPSSLPGEPAMFGYAHFHAGVDLSAPMRTPVRAAEGGQVAAATSQSNGLGMLTGYGNYVDIIAPGGRLERYGHLDAWSVRQGDVVRQYDTIGLLGSTGYSTGPHTHFEVRVNGTPVDPAASMGPC